MVKVSIVLPVYNGEKYLKESVESIIRQTMQDWELIIVDDCSTDGSGKMADEFAQSDHRISVVHNSKNLKLPCSLNIGFKLAHGKYLTWTSDDNCYLAHAIEAMVRFLDDNQSFAMVCTGMLWFDDKWNYIKEHYFYDEYWMHLYDLVGASFLYKRDVLDDVGEYDKDFFCVEDYEYWIRILESGRKIGYLDGVYYLYRVHNDSLSVSKKEIVQRQQRRLYLKHLRWILEGIKGDVTSIMYLYDELLKCEDADYSVINSYFTEYLPLLKLDRQCIKGKICLFGAGENGKKMLKEYKDRVVCLADSNVEKAGKYIEGVVVESIDVMKKRYKRGEIEQIVVSVGFDKQYEVIKLLAYIGIDSYSVMGHYI